MATVKIACPKCTGYGLVGDANETVCPQCAGTGTISVNDAQTLSSINATESARTAATVAVVVTKPPVVPAAAAKVSSRGK